MTNNKEASVILTVPYKDAFTAMWGQISGMADCCGAGVIGRLSGQKLHSPNFTTDMLPTIGAKYVPIKSMREYIINVLPSNKLYAGPPEWLHWAIVEDLVEKKTRGKHTPQIKAKSVATHAFDFENNPYHKFWAGPAYKVQMWFLTDRNGKYMGHHESICVNAFIKFIKRHQLGKLWLSDAIPGAYGDQTLWGGVYHPAYSRIEERLVGVLDEVNAELMGRWIMVQPFTKGVKQVKDKVAKQW